MEQGAHRPSESMSDTTASMARGPSDPSPSPDVQPGIGGRETGISRGRHFEAVSRKAITVLHTFTGSIVTDSPQPQAETWLGFSKTKVEAILSVRKSTVVPRR